MSSLIIRNPDYKNSNFTWQFKKLSFGAILSALVVPWEMPKGNLRKKHGILTGLVICDLVRIRFCMQQDYLSYQFFKIQLSKSPQAILLVNLKSITNPGCVSGQEALTCLALSDRRQRKSIRSQKHQELQWRVLCWQFCFPIPLYHIDLPTAPSLLCRLDNAILPPQKVPKLKWERHVRADNSSGHIPCSSCPLPFPSNKLDALNRKQASKFCTDVSVPPLKSAYTHSKQRPRPEVSPETSRK